MNDRIPLPAAPIAEEWEPFLRAERPTDKSPMTLTERQVSRMRYLVSAVLNADPQPQAGLPRDQLIALETFLSVSIIENEVLEVTTPSPEAAWDRLEAMPYYVQSRYHWEKVEELRLQGLDPYGNPLTGDVR